MTIVGTIPGAAAVVGQTTASNIINSVRDQIPDPVYDSAGNPLPSADGNLLRSQTLVRWISDAVKIVNQHIGWLIDDWTAWPKVQALNAYQLNRAFLVVTDAFADQYQLQPVPEGATMFPSTPQQSQPFWYGVHSRGDGLQLFLWPTEAASDPVTTLSSPIGSTDGSLQVASVTNFLSYGFLQIENELIGYQSITGTTLSGVTRGVGGTIPATHAAAVSVIHCALWAKGKRTPNDVTAYNSIIELPSAFIYPIELYVLAKARQAENEFAESGRLMKSFHEEIARIWMNPGWKPSQGMQIRPYGEPVLGPLAWGRAILR